MRVRKGGLLGRFVQDPAAPPAWWPAPHESGPALYQSEPALHQSEPAPHEPDPVPDAPEPPATDDQELEHEGGAVSVATAPAESGSWLPEGVAQSPSELDEGDPPAWIPTELAPASADGDDEPASEPGVWLPSSDQKSTPAPAGNHKRRRLLPVLVALALLAFAGVAAGVVVAVRSGTSHPATSAQRAPASSTPTVTSPPAAAPPVAKAKARHRQAAVRRHAPAKKHAAARRTATTSTPVHSVVSAPAEQVSRTVTPSAPAPVSSAPTQSSPPSSDPSVSTQQPPLPQAGAPTQTIGSGG